jgi:predicted dehydrogenase
MENIMNPIRFGLIGFGIWPRTAYAPILKEMPEVRVTAVSARNEATFNAARAALHDDLTWHRDYRQLLADDNVDAVMVAIPNALHGEAIAAALDSGKHLFFEPPIAIERRAAEQLLTKAGLCSQVVCADLELRCLPVVRLMCETLAVGTVGDVASAHLRLWAEWARDSEFDWPGDIAEQGWSLWLGCWYLDLLDAVFAEQPQAAHFFAGRPITNSPAPDNARIVLQYGSGRLGHFDYSLAAPTGLDITLHVAGSEGEIEANLIEGTSRWRTTTQPQWQDAHAPASQPVHGFVGMRESIQDFLDAIQQNKTPSADLPAVKRIHAAAFDCRQSELGSV